MFKKCDLEEMKVFNLKWRETLIQMSNLIKMPKFTTIFNEQTSLRKLNENLKGVQEFVNTPYFNFVRFNLATMDVGDASKIPQAHIENERKKLNAN